MCSKNVVLRAIFLLFLFTTIGSAQTVIDPGDAPVSIQAEECAYFSDGLIGECFDCGHDCDLSVNKAEARLAVESLDFGRRRITSTVYSAFKISGDSLSNGNSVSGTLNYDIEWLGRWTNTLTSFVDYDPEAEIVLWVTDLTLDQSVGSRTIHSVDKSTISANIEFIEIGIGRDKDSQTGVMNLNLIRGHTYRVHLSVTIRATAYSLGVLKIDYMLLNRGVWWNDLSLKVAPDLEERIAKLEKRVDSLEVTVSQLQYDLEHHTHTYLTGKGNGHNNVVAETSPAIILDSATVDESDLAWLEDGENTSEVMPVKSVVLSNYPNPFNPSTTILYNLPESGQTKIVLYNVLGQVVKTIVDEYKSAGEHYIELDGSSLASGIYYYRLTVNNFAETRKMTIVK